MNDSGLLFQRLGGAGPMTFFVRVAPDLCILRGIFDTSTSPKMNQYYYTILRDCGCICSRPKRTKAPSLIRLSSSTTRWKQRQGRDAYARDAKVQGLKSRAAFKLLEVRRPALEELSAYILRRSIQNIASSGLETPL